MAARLQRSELAPYVSSNQGYILKLLAKLGPQPDKLPEQLPTVYRSLLRAFRPGSVPYKIAQNVIQFKDTTKLTEELGPELTEQRVKTLIRQAGKALEAQVARGTSSSR